MNVCVCCMIEYIYLGMCVYTCVWLNTFLCVYDWIHLCVWWLNTCMCVFKIFFGLWMCVFVVWWIHLFGNVCVYMCMIEYMYLCILDLPWAVNVCVSVWLNTCLCVFKIFYRLWICIILRVLAMLLDVCSPCPMTISFCVCLCIHVFVYLRSSMGCECVCLLYDWIYLFGNVYDWIHVFVYFRSSMGCECVCMCMIEYMFVCI